MSQFKLIIIFFIILLIIFFIYVNIWIPRFCYHKKLSSSGNCRICLDEFKGLYKPLLAFTMNFLIFSYKKKVLWFSFFSHFSKKRTHQKRYYNSNSFKNTDQFVFTSSCYPLVNKCLTTTELNVLRLSDSDQIFTFIEERICRSYINTLIKGYTDEKLFDTEPFHYRETNNKGLYFLFYNDKKKTDYFYIFYKKKIIYYIDDIEYIIYCVYYLHQNSFDGTKEIMYSCDYIYQNENGSFSYNEKISDIISIFMNKEEEKKDLFFIKALLDKIFILVQSGIEVIDTDLFGTVEINKAPFFFSNNKRRYCCGYFSNKRSIFSNKIFFFHNYTFFFGKYSLSNMNSGYHKLFESVIKLNKNTTEIKKSFHQDLFSDEVIQHRYTVLSSMNVVKEDLSYDKGKFLLSITTNLLASEKDLFLSTKLNCKIGNWNNSLSKFYYYGFFISDNDSSLIVNLLPNQKVNLGLTKQMMDHLIQTNRIKIFEAGSKKQVFTKDNLKYSNLDLSKVDQSKLSSTQDEYVLTDGTFVPNNTILPAIHQLNDINKKVAIHDIEDNFNSSKNTNDSLGNKIICNTKLTDESDLNNLSDNEFDELED